LVTCRAKGGQPSPFVEEQATSLRRVGLHVDLFPISGKGWGAYVAAAVALRRTVLKGGYDLVHAHYGLTGAAALWQRACPVIVTFHGSDVTLGHVRQISRIVARRSDGVVFVAQSLQRQAQFRVPSSVIPCGVDLVRFYPMARATACEKLGLPVNQPLVLFAGAAHVARKNYPLAVAAIGLLPERPRLIELVGYSRDEVRWLLNAANALLLTSLREGSPQIVKEAMACNCPIVGTDVQDVGVLISGVRNCYLTSFEPADVASKLLPLVTHFVRSDGRQHVTELSLENVARRLIAVYSDVLRRREASSRDGSA
jgi:glycosyltransferase involved in cell wall biosynthesis